MNSSVSVKHVARLARVSPATVSRVLNGSTGVSEEKTDRVRRAVQKLGASPKRRPARDKPGSGGARIGLIVVEPDHLHPVSVELFQTLLHVERILTTRKATMQFAMVRHGCELPGTVLSRELDGLLLAGQDLPEPFAAAFQQTPAVWLTSHHEGRHDISLAGNEEIGRMAAQYFIERGHRSLGYLQAPAEHPSHPSRLEFFEFQAAKSEAAVHRLTARLDNPDGTDLADWITIGEVIRKQVTALKAIKKRPTALFVPVGMLAGITHRILNEEGLRPGKDIEVLCCEANLPMIMTLAPRPGVISVNTKTIAERAVLELFHRMENPGQSPADGVRLLIEPILFPGE